MRAHSNLVLRHHVDPVVGISTPDGRFVVGDERVRFEIGSITKVFTAILLADLATSGVVRFSDRVRDLVPPGTTLAPGIGDITLEHLACHRSGLPRLPPGLPKRPLARSVVWDPYADFDADRLIAALAETRLRGIPGRAPFRYSNLGVGLLGHLLGRATRLDYEVVLTERVITPLGLSETSFDDRALHQGRSRGTPVPPWHFAALAGAGALRSTAHDLLTLLDAVRDGGTPLDRAIAETLRPRYRRGPFGLGLGWFLLGRDMSVLMHDGGTLGARSEIRLERPTGTSVVVLGDGLGGTARAANSLLSPATAGGRRGDQAAG